MKALITGITGQDGAYLTRLLLDKGYEVHGIKRRSSSFNTSRLDEIFEKIHLHYGDLTEGSIIKILSRVKPDEIYHLGAMSHVKVSFEMPEYTINTSLGILRIMEAVKFLKLDSRIYNACSSEMFGNSPAPQNEDTIFDPRSPYACSKVLSFNLGKLYREAYGIKVSNGILFNHESPLRGETFVTKKITEAVKKISKREQKALYLGNLDAKRDWGHARDYVRAMHMMLQVEPDDYVIATGKSHTVREFCTLAFKEAGINIDFRGGGINETGVNLENNEILVKIDSKYFRPTEVNDLRGDAKKAREMLKWTPEISLSELIKEMIQ